MLGNPGTRDRGGLVPGDLAIETLDRFPAYERAIALTHQLIDGAVAATWRFVDTAGIRRRFRESQGTDHYASLP